MRDLPIPHLGGGARVAAFKGTGPHPSRMSARRRSRPTCSSWELGSLARSSSVCGAGLVQSFGCVSSFEEWDPRLSRLPGLLGIHPCLV